MMTPVFGMSSSGVSRVVVDAIATAMDKARRFHRLFKLLVLAWGCFSVLGGYGDVKISNIKVDPVMPWGKLYVSFDVEGTLPKNPSSYVLYMTLKNLITGSQYQVRNFDGDKGLTVGHHKLCWDMSAEGVSWDVASCSVKLDYASYRYCVIDLSTIDAYGRYPITYCETISGLTTDESYKTDKLVLKRIENGTFLMQGEGSTTISKPFYMAVFELTESQWNHVMGSGDVSKCPVVKTYAEIRGNDLGMQWPSHSEVDKDSFIWTLRKRTLMRFDLPTEAQWEYACRAGTTTTYSFGDTLNGDTAVYLWYGNNSGQTVHEVGTRKPNPWGLYDMHGNKSEWCLDRFEAYNKVYYGLDPVGSSIGSGRVVRGGDWSCPAGYCTSSYRRYFISLSGVRLVFGAFY